VELGYDLGLDGFAETFPIGIVILTIYNSGREQQLHVAIWINDSGSGQDRVEELRFRQMCKSSPTFTWLSQHSEDVDLRAMTDTEMGIDGVEERSVG